MGVHLAFPEVWSELNSFPFGSDRIGLATNLPFPRPQSMSSLGANAVPGTASADHVYLSACSFVFLQFAVEKLRELECWKQELQDEAHTLIDFFCEDKKTMKLDECFQIFRDFCTRFNKAVKVWLAASVSRGCLDFYFPSSRPSPLLTTERHFASPRFQEHLTQVALPGSRLGLLESGSAIPAPRACVASGAASDCLCCFGAQAA